METTIILTINLITLAGMGFIAYRVMRSPNIVNHYHTTTVKGDKPKSISKAVEKVPSPPKTIKKAKRLPKEESISYPEPRTLSEDSRKELKLSLKDSSGTQREMSELLGVSEAIISDILLGKRPCLNMFAWLMKSYATGGRKLALTKIEQKLTSKTWEMGQYK